MFEQAKLLLRMKGFKMEPQFEILKYLNFQAHEKHLATFYWSLQSANDDQWTQRKQPKK